MKAYLRIFPIVIYLLASIGLCLLLLGLMEVVINGAVAGSLHG
jgi:hypothetical protein